MTGATGRAAAVALVAGAALGCARIEAPVGGPEEFPPPRVVEVRPDTLAVVPGFTGEVEVVFEERLSQRGLEEAVRVEPRTSPLRVSRHLNRLRIGLREGWEPDRIYHVTVLPGIRDRWDGVFQDTVRIVLSTGPGIPDTRLEGEVHDRITGEGVRDARVEAILLPDSLVYATWTDPEGLFRLARIPEGPFRVRAYEDRRGSERLDPGEPRDSVEVEIRAGEPRTVRLRLLEPDTLPPAPDSAWVEEATVIVRFDRHLDPDQTFREAQVSIQDGAGRPVAVQQVRTGDPRTAEDPEDPAPVPLPSRRLEILLEARPAAGTLLRVRVEGVRSVHGLVGAGEVEATVPAEPDPTDPDPPDPDPPNPNHRTSDG